MKDQDQLKEINPEPMDMTEYESQQRDENFPLRKHPWLKVLSRYMIGIQKYSAFAFMTFASIHITSVGIFPGLGLLMDRCQEIFEMSRAIYRVPLFERTFVLGTAGIHIFSGLTLRAIKIYSGYFVLKRTLDAQLRMGIIKDGDRGDVGLGGISGILGLGYRKSTISKIFPSLNPLQFSGYILFGLAFYHFLRFSLIPTWVDGDSSLVNLHFITHYLKDSPMKDIGNCINTSLLGALVVVGNYHFVSGMLKLQHKFGLKHKRLGYGIISTMSALSIISLVRYRSLGLSSGFLGKLFNAYSSYLRI